MKFWKLATASLVLTMSTGVNAAYIKSGSIITDDITGMEWLALSATTNVSYYDALDVANTGYGSGWRYARISEVDAMMNYYFPSFNPTANSNDGSYELCRETEACYLGSRLADVADYLSSFSTSLITNTLADGSVVNYEIGYGYVASPDGAYGNLSTFGARKDLYSNDEYPDRTYVYMDGGDFAGGASTIHGTFLVRDVPPVPVPAALWLFSSGLIGLAGMARRKKI